MSDFKKKFGENLKVLRKSRNFTQEQLAELIDVHFRQMSKIETGENFPSSKTIEKLCCALQVSPATLFNFDFVYEGEIIMTGTDNAAFYRAIRHDNIITLEDYRGKKITQSEHSVLDSDKSLLGMAKRLNKPITVEYFEEDKRTKVLVYNPDGTITSLSGQNEKLTQEIDNLIDSFKNLNNCPQYIDFIKLALDSVDDDDALERLEFMINGIKMARKANSKE